jgi:hypothetical protein
MEKSARLPVQQEKHVDNPAINLIKNIIRVFPYRTSYTPEDQFVFIGLPGLFIPPHDEVHVSCTFTWDRALCEKLKFQWNGITDKPVRLGGPAYESPADEFTPGFYLKSNVVFTSRGCNNNCSWCCVPKAEGRLRELPVIEGNWIQDNNFLQTSRAHKERVFTMLKHQNGICFKGGLQADLIDDHFIRNITSLRISELWLACDTDQAIPNFRKAVERLKRAGFKRDHLRCYVLIGDNMEKNETRLRAVYGAGALPFALLFQPQGDKKKAYSYEWKRFQRIWNRPALTEAHMKHGTRFIRRGRGSAAVSAMTEPALMTLWNM